MFPMNSTSYEKTNTITALTIIIIIIITTAMKTTLIIKK